MPYSNNQISKIAGTLIILGIIIGSLSIVPSVESKNFLNEVSLNKKQVLIGSSFQFLLIPIYTCFALILYRILKKVNKALAIGFIGFRFMAGTFQLLGVILLPLFILLSEDYLANTSSDIFVYELSGAMLKVFRDLTNHLGVIIPTGISNLLLYTVLFKKKLIPKWISTWGFFANILIMISGFLVLYQLIEVISIEYGIMSIPLVLQEIILAFWLLLKGLNFK